MTILLYDLVGEDVSRPFSPHCWKTTMSLAHKGLDYRRVPTPFTSVPAIEDGVSKTVPVIRDGDTVVADSFTIALYLDEAYPDRPTLFGGNGGKAMARFIERWSQLTHPSLSRRCGAHRHPRPPRASWTKRYFRENREKRYGKTLEAVAGDRDAGLAAFRASLEPLRSMLTYQPFIGGSAPLYPDYVVFGAFQWVRIMSPYQMLAKGDPVTGWFERCLDLYDELGRAVPAAA